MKTNHLVEPELQLLLAGYEHGELILDLWGRRYSEGLDVCDVTLHGDKRSLGVLFPTHVLEFIGERAKDILAALGKVQRMDDRDDRAKFDRFMGSVQYQGPLD